MEKVKDKNGVEYFKFKKIHDIDFIKHGFSTRKGGVSKGPFESMNFRFDCEDKKENVVENFRLFTQSFDFNIENVVLTDQTHTRNIRIVTDEDLGKGIIKELDYKNIDGLVTDKNNIGLMTFHADCVPIFFIDIENEVIGLAHSGWEGTYLSIADEMIDIFVKEYNSKPENIIAGIGPSIGSCCYEVGKEIYDMYILKDENFKEFFYESEDDGKYMLDLKGVNKYILKRRGLVDKNILVSDLCTKCNSDIFFSHRAHGNDRGSMAAFICKCKKA